MSDRALAQRLALHRAALETLIRHVESRDHRWRPFVATPAAPANDGAPPSRESARWRGYTGATQTRES